MNLGTARRIGEPPRRDRGVVKYVFFVMAAGIVLGLVPARRLLQIREATSLTTEFCHSVRVGDSLGEVLERARGGADASGEQRVGRFFNVIHEDREGVPSWPRYLVWTGPLYRRVYCSIEPGGEDRVGAIHLGPLDANGIGFFEDWLSQ